MAALPQVRLHPKRDRRVRSGHPWVFSNEIDGDVKGLPPGGAVDVVDAKGKFLGRGTANPHALIAVRLFSRRKDDLDHPAFWGLKIREAVALRDVACPDRRSLRLVHGEADGLPGLTVDRVGDWLVVRLDTVGTEARRETIRQALEQVLEPAGAVLWSTGRQRELEGLPAEVGPFFGDPPEHVDIDEWGVRFRVPLLGGWQDGHPFDQSANRRFAGGLCRGRRVLDVYAGGGGWALHALAGGATQAVAVDKREATVERIVSHGDLNGVSDRLVAVRHEGRAFLQAQVGQSAQYGAVILDPPAFARSRKAAPAALPGYREINALALGLVEQGGLLFTSCRSPHIDEATFLDVVREAAADAGRRLRMIHRGGQGPDFPVALEIPELRSLKVFGFEARLA